jgi:hypothetical protein
MLSSVHHIVVGNNHALLHRLLDYRIALHGAALTLIDTWRYMTVLLGGFIIAWNLHSMTPRWSGLDRLRATFFTIFGLYCAMQEADAVGQAWLVWRLPTLFVLCLLCIAIQLRRTHRGD